MPRYYVDDSSVFHGYGIKYDRALIKKVLKNNGAKNIRLALKYGWSNMPKVVCFSANNPDKFAKALDKALGTRWVIIKRHW